MKVGCSAEQKKDRHLGSLCISRLQLRSGILDFFVWAYGSCHYDVGSLFIAFSGSMFVCHGWFKYVASFSHTVPSEMF